MNLVTTTPENISTSDLTGINRVVAKAFGHSDNELQMLDDTKAHLRDAEQIQVLYDGDCPVALAMYRRCLWQPCD